MLINLGEGTRFKYQQYWRFEHVHRFGSVPSRNRIPTQHGFRTLRGADAACGLGVGLVPLLLRSINRLSLLPLPPIINRSARTYPELLTGHRLIAAAISVRLPPLPASRLVASIRVKRRTTTSQATAPPLQWPSSGDWRCPCRKRTLRWSESISPCHRSFPRC